MAYFPNMSSWEIWAGDEAYVTSHLDEAENWLDKIQAEASTLIAELVAEIERKDEALANMLLIVEDPDNSPICRLARAALSTPIKDERYGRVHADGSRSGGQPIKDSSNVTG